jgi:hypothetical protein
VFICVYKSQFKISAIGLLIINFKKQNVPIISNATESEWGRKAVIAKEEMHTQ